MTIEDRGAKYLGCMPNVTFFSNVPDLTEINESLAEKDKQMVEMQKTIEEMKAQILELRLEKLEKQNGIKSLTHDKKSQ